MLCILHPAAGHYIIYLFLLQPDLLYPDIGIYFSKTALLCQYSFRVFCSHLMILLRYFLLAHDKLILYMPLPKIINIVGVKNIFCSIPVVIKTDYNLLKTILNIQYYIVYSPIFFYQMSKSSNFVPGFVCVLHTFGAPLKCNPHIHCLPTEGDFSSASLSR